MSSTEPIPDRLQRERAETTFDRNVVVVAGAGTGKTTLLVNRLLHLLVKEPEPVPIMRIVALTFTNKAATEMKGRLRERLLRLAGAGEDGARQGDGGAVSLDELRARYGLSTDELVRRARAALHDIEKAQIGTLHSFAAHLLRLHPLESGVDPAFQEDDGSRFEEQFAAAWDVWIDRELSRKGTRHRLWRAVLQQATLDELRDFARTLCSELIDLARVREQIEQPGCAEPLVRWLTDLCNRANALLDTHAGAKQRKIETMLAASASLLRCAIEKGPDGLRDISDQDRGVLAREIGNAVSGWEPADLAEASRIIETARRLLTVDHRVFVQALQLLSPVVSDIRGSFVQKGWLSFDGLLARARTLLRDHPSVRERIKHEYRAVLVDEFQDTDPVQYEIILAVSEQLGSYATAWQEIRLEPGKLFIVGDPKQSIYAFRRADIEAFERVLHKVEADRGMVETLTTNFRSAAAVLRPVNDIFDRVFRPRPHVQPANVRLEAPAHRIPAQTESGVRLRIVTPPASDEPFDAAGATRAEAEMLARWLDEEVLRGDRIKPGHVALLFRKLTQADTYLDALRRHAIAYVIEGEKHFYRRQEVIDLVNLLRVLDNPHDAVALVGLLRSPLAGLTDRDLYDLRQAGLFDYRQYERLDSWRHPSAPSLRRLYEQLAVLHREIPALPLADAIQCIFDRLPVLELAAASLHGEQAVANLLKVKQTAVALADRPHLTLSGFVELMVSRLEEQPDETESPLVEETSDAVQILTIHKAKGLEFPIVVLPGLHQGSVRERSAPTVSYDWSSGLYGLALGGRHTFGSLLLREKTALREEAERHRLLYVGMTRAKDLLVLSGGATARSSSESVLQLLEDIVQGGVGEPGTTELNVGESSILQTVVEATDRKKVRRSPVGQTADAPLDPTWIASLWQKRDSAWKEARTMPLHLSPTTLARLTEKPTWGRPSSGSDTETSRLIGILAHRVLEQWEFGEDWDRLVDLVHRVVQSHLSPDQQALALTVTESLCELFGRFKRSETYERLRSASILGKEVPFVMPWNGGQVMEGVIDVLYRLDGQVWIADYKTDAVQPEEAPARAERYRAQGDIYKEAVRRSLGLDSIRFHCLFLHCGVAVEL